MINRGAFGGVVLVTEKDTKKICAAKIIFCGNNEKRKNFLFISSTSNNRNHI